MHMDSKEKAGPTDVTAQDKFAKIKQFLKKRPPKNRLMYVAGASVIVLIGGVYYVTQYGPKGADPNPLPNIETTYVAPPEPVFSPLTGLEVPSEELANRRVTGVMIENSIDARPQSGLEQAGVVFEAIAEGGITRFLALYQEARPGNIGPIRSARPYYVEWARGFDASYLHSGGSPQALSLIQTLGVDDLDHGNYSSRIADRVSYKFAPHNVYSNFDKIDNLNEELGFTESSFKAFARKYEDVYDSEAGGDAENISFDISGANYNTSYEYDPNTNDYLRTMAGIAHKDQDTGKQISPEVIVAVITTYGIHSNGIHSTYKTTGTGTALVFQDGTVTTGKWKKSTQVSGIEILTKSGEQMELNDGQVWFTLIPSKDRVSYSGE